jgi:pentatricopeptide repeat protein
MDRISKPGETSAITLDEQRKFLVKVLRATIKSSDDPTIVYSLLQLNLDKLDDNFAQVLDNWASTKLHEINSEVAQELASVIWRFSDLMVQFQCGLPTRILEIATIGFKVVASVFTREAFPEEWEEVQNNLCGVFLLQVLQATEDSHTDPEVVYPLLEANLDKLDNNFAQLMRRWATANLSEAEPEKAQWIAKIINEFSLLIAQFPLGSKADNLEIAITGNEIAATVFSKETLPKYWAMVQSNLGNAYSERIRGDQEENQERAIVAYEAALQIYTPETFPELWAMTQNNLGVTYRERIRGNRAANLERTIAYHEAALQIYIPETFPEEWAMNQNNLGNAYSENTGEDWEQYQEQAIKAYKAALQVYTFEVFPEQWAWTQMLLGAAYSEYSEKGWTQNPYQEISGRVKEAWIENQKQAIKAYRAALKVYTTEEFPERWAIVQGNLGMTYVNLGPIARAMVCFRKALKIRTATAFPLECLTTGRQLGFLALAANQWKQAIEIYRLAIEAVEQSRLWARTEVRRQSILSEGIDVYDGILYACIKAGQVEKAIEYLERIKARNLAELLATRNLFPKGNIPTIVLDNLKRLRQEIVTEQRNLDVVEQNRTTNLISGISKSMASPSSWLADRNQLNELLRQLDELTTNEIDPIDYKFKITQQVKPISFEEIIGRDGNLSLIDDRTAILEWYLTNHGFHTFIITTKFERPYIWSSSPTEERGGEEFEEEQIWFKQYLHNYQENRQQWIEELSENLRRLAQIIHIDEILSYLPASCDQLILIPHRFLHLIPLHALPLSEGGCLLDRFPRGVRYAPSCQLLQLTHNQERRNFNRLLAIQNPTKDLGYTTVEVGTIQHYFSHTDVFIENAAQKATLVEVKIKDNGTREVIQNSQLGLANCAHFSCHAEFNFESPLDSALLLADGERLTLGEIFDLDLSQCRLVTLSACETGLTNYKILSDEYVGIPSSFLYAGSPSVVSSLWTVQDVSTAFLMIKFYQNMSLYETVAIALNQAQIWLRNITQKELQGWISENKISLDATLNIRLRRILHKMSDNDKPFKSPFHWAAFCAIGQ